MDARRAVREEDEPGRRRRAARASGGEPRRRVEPMPRAASRSSSCSAALRLKASMRMPDGSAPRSTSSTTRLTRVLVLPEPAGARTRAAPRACSTAARWASSSRTASGPAAGRAAVRSAPSRASAPAWVRCVCGRRALLVEAASPSSRPMSSRSRAAASPTPRLRGASTSVAEREADAERQVAADERVDEAQQDVSGLRRELVGGALPVPEPDGRVAAEQRPAGLAAGRRSSRVARRSGRRGPPPPLAARGRGGSGRRRTRAWVRRPPRVGRRGGVPVVEIACRGRGSSEAGRVYVLRPAGPDASRPPGAQARVTRVDVRMRTGTSGRTAVDERLDGGAGAPAARGQPSSA